MDDKLNASNRLAELGWLPRQDRSVIEHERKTVTRWMPGQDHPGVDQVWFQPENMNNSNLPTDTHKNRFFFFFFFLSAATVTFQTLPTDLLDILHKYFKHTCLAATR